MTVLHNDDPSGVETELRDLLHRRSAGLVVDQPEWQELIERPRTVVFALDGHADGKGGDAAGRDASPWRQRPKPVFIAAAVIAVVLAGGVAAKSATSSSGPTNLSETPTAFSAAAPSDADFDAHTAPAVYASDLADPMAAAQAYLASTGMTAVGPPTVATPEAPTLELLSNADGVATVSWSAVDGSVTRNGTVYLRTSPVEQAQSTGASTWSVVGSTVEGVVLTDVGYEDGQLSFTVTKTADAAGPVAVSVWSNGQQVAVDGDAVQAGAAASDSGAAAGAATEDGSVSAGAGASGSGAGAGAVADPAGPAAGAGQIVDMAESAGSSVPLTAAVEEASTAIVRVQQLVDGQPASITEMGVALPGSDAGASVAGAGSADSDGNADAGVTGDAGASTSTEGGNPVDDVQDEVDDVLEGGTTVPLPDGSEMTTPSVPTTLPPVPSSVPTTLLPRP
jgi:hypothetical protein